MYLRDRIKIMIQVIIFTVVALVAGLGMGYGMLKIGLGSFLTALAWLIVILLLVGCQNTLAAILRELKKV